jgi:hypothetical protein
MERKMIATHSTMSNKELWCRHHGHTWVRAHHSITGAALGHSFCVRCGKERHDELMANENLTATEMAMKSAASTQDVHDSRLQRRITNFIERHGPTDPHDMPAFTSDLMMLVHAIHRDAQAPFLAAVGLAGMRVPTMPDVANKPVQGK